MPATQIDFLKLLLAFRALPRINRDRTFLDVSGYPHYENVASNILAFFFDPTAEHQLDDLLLSAFFTMAEIQAKPDTNGAIVHREALTDQSKRIDLVIENEDFTIAIENKIYHSLGNDLDEYAREIDRTGHRKAVVVKAVLGVRPLTANGVLKGGFVSYRYDQLWQHVRGLLGDYIGRGNPKWVTYLLDFMETTTNLAGQNMELQANDQFFVDHADTIEDLVNQRDAFLGRLNQKLDRLNKLIAELPEAALTDKPKVWAGCCVVLNFKSKANYTVSLDCYLWPTGWQLEFFSRNAGSNKYFHSLVGQPELAALVAGAKIREKRLVLQTWPLTTDLETIRDAIQLWMQAVIKAAAAVDRTEVSGGK